MAWRWQRWPSGTSEDRNAGKHPLPNVAASQRWPSGTSEDRNRPDNYTDALAGYAALALRDQRGSQPAR